MKRFALAVTILGLIGCTMADCPKTGTGMIMSQSSCSEYYICINGAGTKFTCPDGMFFDEGMSVCRDKNLVECSLSQVCPKEKTGVNMVGHPTECSSYFLCLNGEAHAMSCGDGYHFNNRTGACDLPENAKCSEEYRTPTMCPAEGVIRIPHQNNCKKFLLCISGKSFEYNCQGELVFDVRTGKCNWPEISECYDEFSY